MPVRVIVFLASLFLAASADAQDRRPALDVVTGVAHARVEPAAAVDADGRWTDGKHSWIRAAVPNITLPNTAIDPLILEVRAGASHAVAALGQGVLYVRLVGRKLPKTLEVDVWSGQRPLQGVVRPWSRRLVTVSIPAKTPRSDALPGEFSKAFGEYLDRRGFAWWGRTAPFHSFAARRMQLLAGQKATSGPVPGRAARGDIGDMMSLYTGMTSVEEALQADRGLRVRALHAEGRSIPLETLEAVPLKAHPWEAMIAELGKKPQIEPLASRVAADMLYLHFHDLRTAVKMASEMDEWITPLARLVEWRSGASWIAERYERQLMIERTGLSRTLGHLAAHEVAVAVGDPFVREGTDVTLLFRVRNPMLLDSALAGYEASARKRHPDLKEQNLTIGGETVRRVFTPDGAVNQHRLVLDGVLYLSNSRRAIERLVAVRAGRSPSLAQGGDFRYMRTVYPHDTAREDGFAFVSDAFVAKAVGPRTRILQARRMAAWADLSAVGYAALLHGWLEGEPAASARELVKAGYIAKTELRHAGGDAIVFEPARGASSRTWGTTAALTPLSDLEIGGVTEAEKAAYDQFRSTYERYWRTFIDPIAVRLVRSADGKRLGVDARMLPLIERSEYDELIRLVGQGLVHPPKLSGAAQWTFAVGENARLRRELDKLGRMFGRDLGVHFGWLGDWVMLGAGEGAGLWDAAVLAQLVPMIRDTRPRIRDAEVIRLLDRLTVYAGVHVKNPLILAATLGAVRAWVQRTAPGMVEWRDGPVHNGVRTVVVEAAIEDDRGVPPVRIRYAIAKDVLLVSLHEPTLLARIDDVLQGRAPRAVRDDQIEGAVQTHVAFAPAASGPSWLTRIGQAALESEVLRQRTGAFRDMEVLALGLREGIPGREKALAYLGYEPAVVQGGTFEVGTGGRLRHSIYGTEMEPLVPEIPVAGGAITTVIEKLAELRAAISFEGKGNHRGLRAQFSWQQK